MIENGILAVNYHSKLRLAEKYQNVEEWKNSKNIMVATVAFGMGINDETVSKIINFTMPPGINEFL